MPQFGTEVTSMSAPDTRGFSRGQEGVQDRSGALAIAANTGLIEGAGKLAVDAYHGYQIAETEKDIIPIIEEYDNRKNPASIFTGMVKETSDPTLAQFQETTKKYKMASEQGIMSPAEFDTRVRDTLRQAVNKNPGMLKELSDHAANILELSGSNALIKSDISDAAKVAKANEAEKAFILDVAKTAKTPLMMNSDGSIDYTGMNVKNTIWQNENAVIEKADRQDKFTEDQFRDFGTVYVTGKINQVTDLAIATFNDPSIPYEKAMLNANFMLDSVAQEMAADPRVGRILDKPAVQTTMKYMNDQITSIKSNLKSFTSGADAAEYLKNSVNMLRDRQYQDISKTTNPLMLDVLTKLTANAGIADFITRHTAVKVQLLKGIEDIANNLPTSGSAIYDKDAATKKSLFDKVFSSLVIDAGKEGEDTSVIALSNAISKANREVAVMPIDKKYEFYRDYVKTLGASTSKEGLKKLDSSSVQKALTNLDEFSVITLTDMQKTIKKYEDRGIKVNMDILPDGRITMSTNNDQITSELNKKYSNNINDSLLAFANIGGYNSSKEAHEKFYTQYQKFFMSGGLSVTDRNATPPDEDATPEIKTKIANALKAGATIKQIAGAVRRDEAWVRANID